MGIAGILALAAIIASSYGPLGASLAVGILLAAAFGVGWPHYLGIPAKKTLATVISLAGTGAAISAAFTPAPGYLAWPPVFLALGVGAVFVVQLIRGTGQSHRLESTLGAGTGVLLAVLGSGWIAVQRSFLSAGSDAMMTITGVSAAVALLVGLIRWPDRIVAPLAVVLAALAGPMAALLFSDIHIVPAALVGGVVAAVLVSFRRLASMGGPVRSLQGAAAMGIGPVAALGTLVYFIDKLLIT
jgi:hypothetical protein